jgi:biofilm protein TabA
MIFDTIDNMKDYYKEMPELEEAASVLMNLPNQCGSYPMKAQGCRYALSQYTTRAKGTSGFEVHHKFADVQILLEGEEFIDLAFPEGLKERCAFDESQDIQFFDGETRCRMLMKKGCFVVLFPGEAHEPCLECRPETSSVHKIVFKIMI